MQDINNSTGFLNTREKGEEEEEEGGEEEGKEEEEKNRM